MVLSSPMCAALAEGTTRSFPDRSLIPDPSLSITDLRYPAHEVKL